MSWNNISSEGRLRLWKELRNSLVNLPLDKQLCLVAEFFSSMPFGSRSIDYFSPLEWPTPWEILFNGSFCKSSISLLIYYTFVLAQIPDEIELYLIDDGSDEYLIPVIDNQYVLNYELRAVNTLQELINEVSVLHIITKHDIKMIA